MSANWKDELKNVAQELRRTKVKSVSVKSKVSNNKPRTKPWYQEQVSTVNTAGRSASAIKVLKSVLNPELSERLKDINTLITSIHEICTVEGKKDRKVIAARREAETVINYVKSVLGALDTRDIENNHLSEISDSLQAYLRKLKLELSNLEVKDDGEKVSVHTINGDAIEHFAQSSLKLDKEVQNRLTSTAFMIELPVMPIFEGVVTPEKLMQAGLPVEKMAGYPVLLRQRLVALKPEVLEKKRINVTTYLETIVKRIEANSPQNWTVVTEQSAASKKHDIIFYWLMPAKMLTAMTSAAKGSALREWGLAF